MSAKPTLLSKARQGRRAALIALGVARLGDDEDNVISIFDEAFDTDVEAANDGSNVVPFRMPRTSTRRPELLAA